MGLTKYLMIKFENLKEILMLQILCHLFEMSNVIQVHLVPHLKGPISVWMEVEVFLQCPVKT